MKKKSKWKAHKESWDGCSLCSLCENRSKIVLARGRLPCDVLFVGEAPGKSENISGIPFDGPAGQLLDKVIERSQKESGTDYRIGFTNLVSCLPHKLTEKIRPPKTTHIKACSERLIEFVRLAKPKQIVAVGKLAEDHLPKILEDYKTDWPLISIVHPSRILQTKMQLQKDIFIHTTETRLMNMFERMLNET